MTNEVTMPRFLYSMLKQLDLKNIDWNIVSSEMGITNGHAARMRYSRFKAQMEGKVSTPRRVKDPNKPRTPKSKKVKSEQPKQEDSEGHGLGIKLEGGNDDGDAIIPEMSGGLATPADSIAEDHVTPLSTHDPFHHHRNHNHNNNHPQSHPITSTTANTFAIKSEPADENHHLLSTSQDSEYSLISMQDMHNPHQHHQHHHHHAPQSPSLYGSGAAAAGGGASQDDMMSFSQPDSATGLSFGLGMGPSSGAPLYQPGIEVGGGRFVGRNSFGRADDEENINVNSVFGGFLGGYNGAGGNGSGNGNGGEGELADGMGGRNGSAPRNANVGGGAMVKREENWDDVYSVR